MKKPFFLLLASCGIYACTTPEEDAQIRLFWMEQVAQLMMSKQGAPSPLPPQTQPVFSKEEPPQALPTDGSSTETDAAEKESSVQSSLPVAQDASFQQTPQAANGQTSVNKAPRMIEAMLFLSPTCPRCQRLKQDGWIAKFEDKYAGQVRLTVYDLSVPQNDALLENMMHKHHLTRVGYPTLFIAGNVVQGYPLNADPVVAKVLSKQGKGKTVAKAQTQFLEITLEDSRLNKLKSNAPLQDRQAMQRAIERVKQSNQQTVRDIGSMFGADTQAQAFSIIAKSEKILFRTANISSNYQNYLRAQKKILQEQEQQLNQLMRANAYKLKNIRG